MAIYSRMLAKGDLQFVQAVVFPVMLIFIWWLPRNPSARLPFFAVIAGATLWILTTLNVHGYLSLQMGDAGIYLAGLDGDGDEIVSRNLSSRYRFLARIYSFPSIRALQRKFENPQEALRWLEERKGAPLLISGDRVWWNIFFSENLAKTYSAKDEPAHSLVEGFSVQSQGYGLRPFRDIRPAALPGSDQPLAIVLAPEMMSISAEEESVIHHYLGWLARGLSPIPKSDRDFQAMREESSAFDEDTSQSSALQRRALRLDAIGQASVMFGKWRSAAALGTARFFVATHFLLEACEMEPPEPGSLLEADKMFRSALKLLRKSQEPKLVSAALNNLGVTQLLMAEDERWVAAAKRTLLKAGGIKDAGTLPRGARAALLNLQILEQQQGAAAEVLP